MNLRRRRVFAVLAAVALAAAACTGDDTDSAATDAPATTAVAPAPAPSSTGGGEAASTTTTDAAATTSTGPAPATTPAAVADGTDAIVTRLAGDELTGRNENTDGWFGTQAYLAEQLAAFADPIDPSAEDTDGYLQHTASAVNVIGVIPGTELPDEYVLVGAHYDHLGIGECPTNDPADTICNGAADNAAGVAVALAAVRQVVAQTPPRRSILIAFWDREEDGLSATDDVPVFQPDAPVATFADAQAMLGIVTTGQADFGMLPPDRRAAADTYVADMTRIVGEGEAAFDDADVAVVLGGAAALVTALVTALAEVPCDAYLD